MGEIIKHKCGIAFIRLRKDLEYYIKKYNTPNYALDKLRLLMEKQRNRGQEGAGVGCIKIGHKDINYTHSIKENAIGEIWKKITEKIQNLQNNKLTNTESIKNNVPFVGEIYMGHLRYCTYGSSGLKDCQPVLHEKEEPSRSLLIGGNFNMTNTDFLLKSLNTSRKLPIKGTDTTAIKEIIADFLNQENNTLIEQFKNQGYPHCDILNKIEEKIDMTKILHQSCKNFDGGYVIAGIIGYGGAFIARDPLGIRPAYYYADEEVIVTTSEKPPIKIAFNINYEEIKEIDGGEALIIEKDGSYNIKRFAKKIEKRACSFERIYFSRGTDPAIYKERKKLGELLCPQILQAINYDLENTVFSYVPNTAEIAFLGLVSKLKKYLTQKHMEYIEKENLEKKELKKIFSFQLRLEKLIVKDTKLRTFISARNERNNLITHSYDTTYGIIRKNKDTLVIIDDSIVRGNTLEKSIIRMLDILQPKRIIIVSSSPQIRYPDCYGIDMSQIGNLVAFKAVNNLLKRKKMEDLKWKIYEKSLNSIKKEQYNISNYVKQLYSPFSDEDISEEIANIVKQNNIKAEIKIIYQTVENLHKACPNHKGDWYFTGNYPTPGGNRIANNSFINFMKGKIHERPYEQKETMKNLR